MLSKTPIAIGSSIISFMLGFVYCYTQFLFPERKSLQQENAQQVQRYNKMKAERDALKLQLERVTAPRS
jgi:cell division protein FtsB